MNFDKLRTRGKQIWEAAGNAGRLLVGAVGSDVRQTHDDTEQQASRLERYRNNTVSSAISAGIVMRRQLLETPLSDREAKVREFYTLYENERLRKMREVYPEPVSTMDPLVAARICLHAAGTAGREFEGLERSASGKVHAFFIDEFRLPEQYFLFTDPDERVDEVVELLPDTRRSAIEIMQAWLINAVHETEIRPEMPPPPHPSLAHANCSFFDTWMGIDLTYEDIGVTSPPDERKIAVYLSGTKEDGIVLQVIPDFMAHAEVWINS